MFNAPNVVCCFRICSQWQGQPDRKEQFRFEKPDDEDEDDCNRKKGGRKPKAKAKGGKQPIAKAKGKAVLKKPAAREVAGKDPAQSASEAPVTPHRAQGDKQDNQDSAPKASPKLRRVGKQPVDVDPKPEEKAAEPKANTEPKAAKAKASPKAAAGGKPASKRTSEVEGDEPKSSKKAKTEEAREKVFAGRPCPSGEGPSLRWRGTRDVYESKVRQHYRFPSKLQDQ